MWNSCFTGFFILFEWYLLLFKIDFPKFMINFQKQLPKEYFKNYSTINLIITDIFHIIFFKNSKTFLFLSFLNFIFIYRFSQSKFPFHFSMIYLCYIFCKLFKIPHLKLEGEEMAGYMLIALKMYILDMSPLKTYLQYIYYPPIIYYLNIFSANLIIYTLF